MGSEILDVGTFGSGFHHMPDRLGCDPIAPDLAQGTYSSEDRATADTRSRGPLIHGKFRPERYRNGTDVPSFANKVSDYPVLLADLENPLF